MTQDTINITQLKSPTIVGIHPWEKINPQVIFIDAQLTLPKQHKPTKDQIDTTIDYSHVTNNIVTYCKKNQFNLIESLANQLCQHLLETFDCPKIILTIHKPQAIPNCQNISLTIERNQTQ